MTKYLWHFAAVDREGIPRLGYNDNREIRIGETLTVEGEPVLCEHGLHASERIISALQYVKNDTDHVALCCVTLDGNVISGDDKSVANSRTVHAMLNADDTDELLRSFARWCALQVIEHWDAPQVVIDYLRTGDEDIRPAAWAAAWPAATAAARSDARAAATAAATAAAWPAAWAAAWPAATAVATAAARSDARAAATAAARSAQNAELERRALAAMELR